MLQYGHHSSTWRSLVTSCMIACVSVRLSMLFRNSWIICSSMFIVFQWIDFSVGFQQSSCSCLMFSFRCDALSSNCWGRLLSSWQYFNGLRQCGHPLRVCHSGGLCPCLLDSFLVVEPVSSYSSVYYHSLSIFDINIVCMCDEQWAHLVVFGIDSFCLESQGIVWCCLASGEIIPVSSVCLLAISFLCCISSAGIQLLMCQSLCHHGWE